jgi:hypothetical protein
MTDLSAARRFFTRALRAGTVPVEVATGRAPVCPRVPDELVPSALHTVEQHANNPTGADHGRLKARPRAAHGLKRHRSVKVLPVRTCLRTEPALQPLRHHHSGPERRPAAHRLRRPRAHDLSQRAPRSRSGVRGEGTTQQRPPTRSEAPAPRDPRRGTGLDQCHDWFRPLDRRYQHRFSTETGTVGK